MSKCPLAHCARDEQAALCVTPVEKVQPGMYSTPPAGLIIAHVTHAGIAAAGVNKLNDCRLINLVNVQKCFEMRRTGVQISPRQQAVRETDLNRTQDARGWNSQPSQLSLIDLSVSPSVWGETVKQRKQKTESYLDEPH